MGMQSRFGQLVYLFLFFSSLASAVGRSQSPLLSNNEIAGSHFILVGGLNNEAHGDYFKALERFLKANGAREMDRLMPSSLNSVAENIPLVRDELLRLYATGRRPLYIVAHSKGGLEVANAVIRYSDRFPDEVLSKAIFANTPFQGSPFTGQAIEDFKAVWGWGLNLFNPVYLNALRVLNSLRTEAIHSDLSESFKNRPKVELESLSQRVFYFRSAQSAKLVDPEFKKSAEFLKVYGPNDGVIPVVSQMLGPASVLESFGNDLGVMDNTDHRALFVYDNPQDPTQASRLAKIFGRISMNILPMAPSSQGCSQLFENGASFPLRKLGAL